MNPLETAADSIASKMTGQPKGFAFDPTLIVTIVAALMSMFGGCLQNRSPQDVAKRAERLGIFERAYILNHCRHHAANRREAYALYAAVTDAAEEATAEEIMECCAAASQMGGGLS